MFILKYKTDLLHFLKGSLKPFSKIFLSKIKKDYKSYCHAAIRKEAIDENHYLRFQNETGWIRYLEYFVFTIKYLTGDNTDTKLALELVKRLENPELNSTTANFYKNLDHAINIVKEIERDMGHMLTKLTCLECERLGEAVSCLWDNYFMASTVMAASAVEARLHTLIERHNKTIYRQHFQKKTLGALIKLFDKNEYKDKKFNSLKKIVPDKHKSLLDIVNSYRIFSAHPIGQKIDYRIAETVLNLSFLFLLDPGLKIVNEKLLKHTR